MSRPHGQGNRNPGPAAAATGFVVTRRVVGRLGAARSGSRELDRDRESVAELVDEPPRGNDARIPHALKSQQISLVSGHEVVRRAG